MRRSMVVALLCGALATACSDRPTQPAAVEAVFEPAAVAHACISADSVVALIRAVFPAGQDRNAALSRFRQVRRLLGPTPPGPDTAIARHHALELIDFTVKKFRDGRLIGGTSDATQALTIELLNGILCTVGLPASLGPGVLGPDGAVGVVTPSSPTTTIVTATQFAGVEVPGGAVTEPTLVTVRRLPDSPPPLLTQLDQYPLFYEYTSTSGFTADVLVGVCVATSVTPPDPSRLRLAHNVPPFTMGSIEILPFVPAPFLDCTDADLSATPGRWRLRDLARDSWLGAALAALVPRPLEAAVFKGSGLGGTVRTFSPFGAVDTLAVMTAAVNLEQHTHFGETVDFAPAVHLRTPTGRAMAGVGVTFVVTAGGGTLDGGNAVSDEEGLAATTQWTLGFVRENAVVATPFATPGSGFLNSPITFRGIAFAP